MSLTIEDAVFSKSLLRMAIIGPPGTGKTFSALAIADGMVKELREQGNNPGPITLIDSERNSSLKYARFFGFKILSLPAHSPETYTEAVRKAEQIGSSVICIDSFSHAWVGRDGALELVDREAAKSRSGSSYHAWRSVTPLHNRMIDTIISSPAHVITTLRSKVAHVQEKDERTGKTVIRKVGLEPVQRDGVEYEFDLVGDIDQLHEYTVTKSRFPEFDNQIFTKPGLEFGRNIIKIIGQGEDAPPLPRPWEREEGTRERGPVTTGEQASQAPIVMASEDQLTQIKLAIRSKGLSPEAMAEIRQRFGPANMLTAQAASRLLMELTQ